MLELAQRGQRIRAMKRDSSSVQAVEQLFADFSASDRFNQIEWVEGNLFDLPLLEEILEGIDTIYHCAASVSFDDRQAKEIRLINHIGTENLVNLAISNSISNFIFVSSIATLDALPDSKEIDENAKWNPELAHSEYAISKKKAEMEVWRASQEGVRVLVVCPGIVIGSLDGKRESEKIFQYASKSKAYATEGMTGYVDVRDVAYCMAELVSRSKWNEKYLLVAENKSYVWVFDYLRKKWGMSPTQILSKGKLKWIKRLSVFSRLFGGRYLSRASFHGLTGKTIYTHYKVCEDLGFGFLPVEKSLDFHSERYKKLKK